MVALAKYNALIDEVSKGGHNLQTAVLKAALTNTAPNQATDTTWSAGTYPPPSAANGYTAGGNTLTTSSASTSGGTFKLVLADTIYSATTGGIGPFRYVVIYNSSASNKVIGFYDYASSISLAVGDTFTIDFDNVNGALTIA